MAFKSSIHFTSKQEGFRWANMQFNHSMIIALTLIFLTTLAQAARFDVLNSILADYVDHKDINLFCEDFHDSFRKTCRDDISPDQEDRFREIVTNGQQRAIVAYINAVLIEQDPELELSSRDCARFDKLAKEADSTTYVETLSNKLADRGYDFKPDTKRAQKLQKIILEVVELKTCNLGAIGAMFGKVTKHQYGTGDAINDVSNYMSKQYERIKQHTMGNTVDVLDDELKEEEDRIRKLTNDILAKRESIKAHTKGCIIDSNEGDCYKLRKEQDIIILENLGISATKMAKLTPALRDTIYYMATWMQWYDMLSVRGKIRNASLVFLFIIEHAPIILMALTLVALWFRSEMRSIVGLGFFLTGFGIVPIAAMAKGALGFISKRGKGIMLSLTIAFATYGIQTYNLTAEQALGLMYVVVVAYFSLTDKEKSPIQVLAILAPLPIYVAISKTDFALLSNAIADTKVSLGSGRFSYKDYLPFVHLEPELLPAVALAACLTVFNLCCLCDSFGYNTYRDVSNAKSGKNKLNDFKAHRPTMADYVTASLNGNSLVVLAAAAAPGFLMPVAWFWTFSVYAIALITSGLMYMFMYHEAFVKEGETAGATTERILDSINIIVGMAPKSVILPKFQHTVTVMICAAAFTMCCKVNIETALIATALAAIGITKEPSRLLFYMGWCCGLVIMFSGSLLHAIIGLAYIYFKVYRNIKFNLSSMGIGETIRELSIEG